MPVSCVETTSSFVKFTYNVCKVNWALFARFLEEIAIDLCFLLDKICSEEIVCGFSHLERLLNIQTHRLLLHSVLHLLSLVSIVIELVHDLVHALLVHDLQVLLACLLYGIHLSGFHVLCFDLPRDERTTLLAAQICRVQLNETVRI